MTDDQDAMVKDLVQAADNVQTEFALDSLQQLLKEERDCAANIKWWTERRKMIQSRIIAELGDHEIGTVDGAEVVTYKFQDRFDSTSFRQQWPNLYETYSRSVTEKRFDAQWLKEKRPDLYRKFQVRAFRNVYEAPGESAK